MPCHLFRRMTRVPVKAPTRIGTAKVPICGDTAYLEFFQLQRQGTGTCGMHALNNLLACDLFSVADIEEVRKYILRCWVLGSSGECCGELSQIVTLFRICSEEGRAWWTQRILAREKWSRVCSVANYVEHDYRHYVPNAE